MIPSYWQQAARELAAADERMGELVERYAGVGLVSGSPMRRRPIQPGAINIQITRIGWNDLGKRSEI